MPSGLCWALQATLRDCGAPAGTVLFGLSGGPHRWSHPAWASQGPGNQHSSSPLPLPCWVAAASEAARPLQGPGAGTAEPTAQPLEADTAAAASGVPQTQAGGISVRPQRGSVGEEAGQLSGACTGQLWLRRVGVNQSGCSSVQVLLGLCWSAAGWAAPAGQLKAGTPCQPRIL